MLFSVIIPAFNRKELLLNAIESVLAQTYKDFELIVVDDGSTDGTVDALKSLGTQVRVLQQANSGPSIARNLGVLEATGDYLAFLDSDDLWLPCALQTYLSTLLEHGPASMLRSSCREFRGQAPLIADSSAQLKFQSYGDFLEGGGRGVQIGAGQIAVRRDRFLSCGGFDPALQCAEDYDLALRIGVERGFVEILAPVQMLYRRHASLSTQALGHTVRGAGVIIHREKTGEYPGGRARRLERTFIISRMVRPISVACLRRGMARDAWSCYWNIFRWNLRLGNWRYLLGFPLYSMGAGIRSRGALPRERTVA